MEIERIMNPSRRRLLGTTSLIAGGLATASLIGCTTNSTGGFTVDLATAQKWVATLPNAFSQLITILQSNASKVPVPATVIAQAEAALGTAGPPPTAFYAAVAQFEALAPGAQGVSVAQQVLNLANAFLGDIPVADLPPNAATIINAIQIAIMVISSFITALPLAAEPKMPAALER